MFAMQELLVNPEQAAVQAPEADGAGGEEKKS